MRKHELNAECKCATCRDHFIWLELHLRALADHKREQETKPHDPLLD